MAFNLPDCWQRHYAAIQGIQMKILVTGGTGVIGTSVVHELHRRGHGVTVLTRHADRDKQSWPAGVEAWSGDISDEKSVRGAADGCDAILHIAGIVDENPPAATFQSVNIEGTRHVVLEAERAAVKKIVFISSLGAARGASGYHKSKCVAEDVVQTFTRDWVVVRPGAVYGPGDEHISMLVRMVRSLPVLPTIGDGNQQFQPVWHEDLSRALAAALERDDVRCASFDVTGPDLTSQNDLIARLRVLTNRPAVQAPLPELLAEWGVRALDALGVDVPFTPAQFDMLREGNVVAPDEVNALATVFGVQPTSLEDGLRRLLDVQPAQLPSEGVGVLTRKQYWIDIRGGRFDADGLFAHVRAHLAELMPPSVRMKAEPHASTCIDVGETLTIEVPVRGHIQVRVAEAGDRRITLLTLAGHPIAGAVRFFVEPHGDAVRFMVQVYDRPASTIDQILMYAVGGWLQRGSWIGLVENVASAAGGGKTSSEVQTSEAELDAREAELVDQWASKLSAQLSRNSTSRGRD
jgi:NADH dehydrogenase